jgi:hypothetical protein
MTTKTTTYMLCINLALAGTGCAGAKLAPMDPSRPIETEHGYTQNGTPIDPESMTEQLERERAAAPAVKRAKTLATLAVVLCGIGGALIGWPIGQWAAGEEDPIWPLAYAGVGALGVSVPLVVWSNSSMNSAIDAHNRGLGPRAE